MLPMPPRRPRARRPRAKAALSAMLLAPVMATTGFALLFTGTATAEDEWRAVLRQQLQSQYGCRLDRFVFERQVPLGSDITREGRIQCADGREVDYAQPNILLKFELRLCAPTVC